MKKILLSLGLLLLAGFALLLSTFGGATLDPELVRPAIERPVPRPPEGLRISVLRTGEMFSQQIFSFRGGDAGTEQISAMDAVLIDHPEGRFLIDTGFGRDVDQHVRTTPLLMRSLAKYAKATPVADQLASAGLGPESIRGILLTHSHWDHVSGIVDLPGVPVWVNAAERDFIEHGGVESALIRGFEGVEYQSYAFDGGPYLGYERSHDLFADGSVVLAQAGGHTPGSVVIFVHLPSGKSLAFLGDLVWAREAIRLPAERPFLARRLVDHDAAEVRRQIVHLHHLSRALPEMVLVPAHDRRVFETLAAFPDFEG